MIAQINTRPRMAGICLLHQLLTETDFLTRNSMTRVLRRAESHFARNELSKGICFSNSMSQDWDMTDISIGP